MSATPAHVTAVLEGFSGPKDALFLEIEMLESVRTTALILDSSYLRLNATLDMYD